MSEPITHITQVEIQQLWKEPELNIKWNLHRDVNILAGDNGSGKSTILNVILWSLLLNDTELSRIGELVNRLSIKLHDKSNKPQEVRFRRFDGTIDELRNEAETDENLRPSLYQIITRLDKGFSWENGIPVGVSYRSLNDKRVKIEEIRDLIQVDDITTFDPPLLPLESVQKFTGEKRIKTHLDFLITELEKTYLDYQVEIGKLALKALSSDTDIEEVRQVNQQLNAKKNLFLDMMDELFGSTQKTIDRDDNSISFIKRGKTKLSPYNLSSGEKQMLMILLTALVQNNKPAVMIMDEPELSLHTDWQEKLINYIRQLNENVQIIIATHSPSIVINGWQDKVFEINDILVK